MLLFKWREDLYIKSVFFDISEYIQFGDLFTYMRSSSLTVLSLDASVYSQLALSIYWSIENVL